MLDSNSLSPVASVRSLGVLLDLGLILDNQVAAVARSAYSTTPFPGLEGSTPSYSCSGNFSVQLL